MDLLTKYRKIKQLVLSIADNPSVDSKLRDELQEFEHQLQLKEKVTELETENYKMFFENAVDFIFILSKEGIILSANVAACKKYQIPFEEFVGTSILEIDVSKNRDIIKQNVEELLLTGNTRFEAVHKNRIGETFTLDVTAQEIIWNNDLAYIHVCRDITRQKQLQRALNESEVKLKKIIDQITDGIIIYEQSGKIIIWNSGAEKITGIKREDALGQLLYELQYDILHGIYKNKGLIRKMFDEVVNMTNPAALNNLFENNIYVKGKGVRTLQAIVFPIELEADKRLFGSVIRDITEMKKIENQLRDLNATKDKIFSIIAHDLRTPFSSIIGFTDLLLNNFDKYDSDRVKKILQYINLSAKPTLDVLTNLLNWVSVQTGQLGFQPEKCRLKLLVKEVIEILTPTATIKNIMLSYNIPEDFEVYADVNMLKSVVQNLITNSIKFSHAGGSVDVRVLNKGEFIEFEISDEGVGINEKQKEALFLINSQKSTTGTSGEKGSGLGLILCKEFIEKHGGKIHVESRQESGSRFVFTIPLDNKKHQEDSRLNENAS